MARHPRRVGGDRVGRPRGHRALRGHHRARVVLGAPTRRHRLVRIRTRDAAGRDVPGGRGRHAGECLAWPWRSNSPAVAGATSRSGCWRSRTWSTGDQAAADDAMAEAIASARAARNDGLAYAIVGHRALLAMDRGDWAAATAYTDRWRVGSPRHCRSMGISRAPSRASPAPASPSIAATSAQRDGRCCGASICGRC